MVGDLFLPFSIMFMSTSLSIYKAFLIHIQMKLIIFPQH